MMGRASEIAFHSVFYCSVAITVGYVLMGACVLLGRHDLAREFLWFSFALAVFVAAAVFLEALALLWETRRV
jgi:ABC-type multidrug transport system permease subunit